MAGTLRSDGRRVMVHPADVSGRFASWRKLVFLLLIAVYAALPWIRIGGHPAVFIDIPRRHFYLFGAGFDARDLWMLTLILVTGSLAIFWVTALLGRAWCGWACPQTVFLEAFYRRAERWIQGSREKRMRGVAVWKKVVTHAVYVAISLVLAHVFLAYFVSLPELLRMVRQRPSAHLDAFVAVMVLSGLFYFDFGWFREQFCVAVCPYGRLQGVLLDADSLVIGYDQRRGEPRGKVGASGAGDCVDCKRCVAVCPTGIDIREGLQLDCVACTACIDACDEIMDKVRRPRGLIRYDSQRGLGGERRRFVRARVVVYSLLLVVAGGLAAFGLRSRDDIEATVLRPPGTPYTLGDGQVRDVLDVHVVNKRNRVAAFVLSVEQDEPTLDVHLPIDRVELQPLADAHVPVLLTVPVSRFRLRGSFPVHVRVHALAPDEDKRVTALFLGPEAP